MNISDQGIQLIRSSEGLSLDMYVDAAGYPTIGYGHKLSRDERNSGTVTINRKSIPWRMFDEDMAESLLKQDIDPFVRAVNEFVHVPINQAQFDALVSFAYNVGASAFACSTMVRKLNKGDYNSVPVELRKWNKISGKTVAGLTNRRRAEIQLWSA